MDNPATPRRRHIFDSSGDPAISVRHVKVPEPGLVQDIIKDRLVSKNIEPVRILPRGNCPYEVVHAAHTGHAVESDHPGIPE
jgi:hypothetical protein